LAASSRLVAGSTAISWPGENNLDSMMAASPIGPQPTTTTVSPGRTCPFSTPTS
jgi:hypothetical protein